MLDFIKNLGPTEIIVIAIILIVFFGSKKIASFGKEAGEATKEFKKAKKELVGAIHDIKSDGDSNSDSGSREEVQQ